MSLASIGALVGIAHRDGGGSIGETSGGRRAPPGHARSPSCWIMPPLCHQLPGNSINVGLRCRPMQRNGSGGVVALQGGGPFVSNDELDRQLLSGSGIERVVMLPTADAFEQPALLVAAAEAWGGRIGVTVEPLMVMTRADAERSARGRRRSTPCRRSFLAGDSASHLRSVLKDTPLFQALVGSRRPRRHPDRVRPVRGGTLRSDDRPTRRRFRARPRTGAGAGRHPRAPRIWPREQIERAHTHADTPLVDLPTGSAIVRRDDAWEVVGDADRPRRTTDDGVSSAPGEDGLLEVVDSFVDATGERDLAELVEHGAGRGVDVEASERQLHHRPFALRDGRNCGSPSSSSASAMS